jgi:hypothetical protein
VRVLQIQLCMIYLTTGLAKLKGETFGEGPLTEWLTGNWWDGTAIHYVLNYTTKSRWAYAQFPIPLWITKPLTYLSVWWETLFPLLVLSRWTRPWALWFGVLFHVGIFLTIEVGWFSFYTLAYYGVWVPCAFWARFDRASSPDPAASRQPERTLAQAPGATPAVDSGDPPSERLLSH